MKIIILIMMLWTYLIPVIGQQSFDLPPKHIRGGEPAMERVEFPFIVTVQSTNDYEKYKFCTGSVIDQYWVLTAGHCLYQEGEYVRDVYVVGPIPPTHGKRVVVHPDYDIGLIQFERPLTSPVSPVKLMSPSTASHLVVTGALAWAVGLGQGDPTLDGAEPRGVLRQVELPLWTGSDCRSAPEIPSVGRGDIEDWELCGYGGFGSSKSTAPGDSGSPLLMKTSEGWEQIGVATRLFELRGADVSLFASVSYAYDWIQEQMVSVPNVLLSSQGDIWFSDFTNGDGWTTQLSLINKSNLRDVQGSVVTFIHGPIPSEPESFPLFGEDPLMFDLPPKGTKVFKSDGRGSLVRGAVLLKDMGSDFPVAAVLTYQHSATGLEVSVLPAVFRLGFLLLTEESDTVGTGLAIGKNWETRVCLVVRDADGDRQGSQCYGHDEDPTDNFMHSAKTIREWVPDVPLPPSFTGSVLIYGSRHGNRLPFILQGIRFSNSPGRSSLSALPESEAWPIGR